MDADYGRSLLKVNGNENILLKRLVDQMEILKKEKNDVDGIMKILLVYYDDIK